MAQMPRKESAMIARKSPGCSKRCTYPAMKYKAASPSAAPSLLQIEPRIVRAINYPQIQRPFLVESACNPLLRLAMKVNKIQQVGFGVYVVCKNECLVNAILSVTAGG